MSITNATTLRKKLFDYLDAAVVNDEQIVVTTKEGNAVIVSEEYLRGLEETCYLCSVPGMRETLLEGLNTPVEDCVEFDWRKDLK